MLQDLPLGGLIAVVFGATFLVTIGVYVAIMALAARGRANAFKAFSPGMLPPMGLLFGLIVGFMAAQIWSDAGRAQDAVDREASALRSVVLLAEAFPGTTARFDALVGRQIRTAVDEEWPAMALAEALQLAIGLSPRNDGERTAQRELVDAVQDAFDARRQRIIVSESGLNWVKWTGVIFVALLTLISIAFVHSDNRLSAKLALGVFAAAVATSLTLLAAQERPFSGQFAVRPDVLLQVQPNP
jgi:hypothetical protein